jgi:hypothetical protein
MAELVDALVSGTSVRKDVQVRVLFQAHLRHGKPGQRFTGTSLTLQAQVVELVDTPA